MAESVIAGRALEFARRVARLSELVAPRGFVARRIAGQLFDAATSIGANTEEAQGAQTKRDFVARLCVARKEAFEARYWLRLLRATKICEGGEIDWELAEVDQLIAMTTRAVKTAQASASRGEPRSP